MSDAIPFKIEFPPVRPENLIRLAEDLLHVFSDILLNGWGFAVAEDRRHVSSISDMVSRGRASPRGLSSAGATELEETFRNAISVLSSPTRPHLLSVPWLRLYAHALLCESRIFPDLELSDESPGCTLTGFTDTWKGKYHGQLVCIKAIRTRKPISMKEIEKMFRRVSDGNEPGPHPNVLHVIDVSDSLFPFCVMTPWMPDGNIIMYTQANPNANRLLLLAQACQGLRYLHRLEVFHGSISPNNILITRDGRACLGDFGIASAFEGLSSHDLKLGTIRYMAPECFFPGVLSFWIISPSREKDVYSMAMASFSVLAGVSPYSDNSDPPATIRSITRGERPSRPRNPSQSQWLPDRVWDAITTGWSDKPEQRSELAVLYHVFSTTSQQEVQDVIPGLQQLGGVLPRIASFFQFLRDPEPEIQRSVDEMDERLKNHNMSDRERLRLFNKICKTCSRGCVIPKSMHIPDCSKDSVEVESGGFADVSRGTYDGRQIAIKVVRAYVTDDLDVIGSRFCREAVAWKHLRHPNILPLLGVTVGEYRFEMVSEWMENGNITDFIKQDRQANRAELLVDVANGLKYMHDLRIVHGDLKGANILIDDSKRARVADFGLSTITGVTTHPAAEAPRSSLISNDTLMSFTDGGTRRWMSPELLHPERFGMPESENNRPTRQSDCYALGMVIYEVLCGHHPYLEFPSDILAVNAIVEGARPKKPEDVKRLGFSNELWRIVELSWLEDRNSRPGVEDILSCLNDAVAFWHRRKL